MRISAAAESADAVTRSAADGLGRAADYVRDRIKRLPGGEHRLLRELDHLAIERALREMAEQERQAPAAGN